jgi:hypothetical protein
MISSGLLPQTTTWPLLIAGIIRSKQTFSLVRIKLVSTTGNRNESAALENEHDYPPPAKSR